MAIERYPPVGIGLIIKEVDRVSLAHVLGGCHGDGVVADEQNGAFDACALAAVVKEYHQRLRANV
jgi:hypothetical protein